MHSNNQEKVFSWNDVLNISLWLITNFQHKNSKMASVVKYIVVLAMFIQTAQSDLLTITICKAACEGTCNGCVKISEGLLRGLARFAATVLCKTAEGVCKDACDLAGLWPTLYWGESDNDWPVFFFSMTRHCSLSCSLSWKKDVFRGAFRFDNPNLIEELPILVYIKQNISITWLVVIQSKVKKLQVCVISYTTFLLVCKKKDLRSRLKHSFHSLVVTYGDLFFNKWWSQWIYLHSGGLHLKTKR